MEGYVAWFFQPLHTLLNAAALDERRCTLCHIPYSPPGSSLPDSLPEASGVTVRSGKRKQLPLCPSCRFMLRRLKEGFCPRCGQLFHREDAPSVPCGECFVLPPPWRHFRFHGMYSGALRTLMLRGKFGNEPGILRLLGHLLAEACRDLPRPDAIVPIPLHSTRLRERGFNQSLELARPISVLMGVPIRPHLLLRVLPTRHQTGLNRKERMNNLQNAFSAHPGVIGKTILLIDDTLTTGTTLRRATRALLDQGAAVVDVAVVARTPREREAEDQQPTPTACRREAADRVFSD